MKKYIFSGLILLLIPLTALAGGSNAGKTGLAFLKIGVGSRAIGMGEAYTAISDDATATYWNPAGLTYLKQGEFHFTHNQWLQDISTEFLAVAFSVGPNKFGLSLISTSVPGIERRVKPSAEPLGTITAHDIALGLSFSRQVFKNISMGVSVKFLYEKIYIDHASGGALDLGVIYQTPFEGLRFGWVVLNLGGMSELKNESIRLPQTIKLGVAYVLPESILGGKILLASDMAQVIGGKWHSDFGVEYQFEQIMAFRTGYQIGFEEKGLQGGLGIKLSRYRLDYAFVPYFSDIGEAHRISFAITF